MPNAFELTLHLGGTSHSFSSVGGLLMVGRDPSCEVVIPSEEVALHHASLWLEGTRLQVEDLTGLHTTLVNGYDISGRVEVECPASVQVGPAVLVVKVCAVPSSEDASAIATVGMHGATDTLGDAGYAAQTVGLGTAGGAESGFSGPDSGADGMLLGMGPRSASVQVQYALGQEIARGGMGRIYRGEDPHLKREVAIKVSSSGGNGDPRFAREAEVLGNLPHPNIVPIHAMGEDEDGFPFYSMKLVKGQTLQAVIKSLRDRDPAALKLFTRERLLTVFRKVCDAMAFAHSKGILHRDLKPENVMVGEFGEVLVMDWGLAKKLGEKETVADTVLQASKSPGVGSGDLGTTLDGEVLGTPQYMSPEQAQGRLAELDERADIYSLGALLYSILTLRPPVEGDTLDELLTKVRSGQISSMATKRTWVELGHPAVGKPAEMGLEVPEALRAVTLKAMALDKIDRYQTVDEFVADIDSYTHGYATRAEHAGPVRLLLLLLRRHKAVSGLLFVMLLGAAAFTFKLIASERLARDNERVAEANALSAEASAQKAAQEAEHARRTAAEANMALVEAAERDLDGEEMQRTLAAVPVDLRDQKWEYLNAKLEAADVTAEVRDQSPWTAMVAHPQKPGILFTLQTNGWVRTLDLKKEGGAIEDLFRLDTANLVDVMGVSRDGSKGAFVRYQVGSGPRAARKASIVEVVQMDSGKKIAELKLPPTSSLQLAFHPEATSLLCIYRTPADELQHFELRNLRDEVEWERQNEGNVWAEFKEDGKSLRVFSERNGILELDTKTGELQRTAAKVPWPAGGMNRGGRGLFGLQCVPSKDWSSVVTFQNSGARFMRRYDTNTGKVLFENRCLSVIGMLGLPESNLIVTLSQRSDRCVVLQYWHRDTGLLIKSMPLLGNMKGGWMLAVHPQTGDVAVVNGKKLRCWNFQTSKPLTVFPAGARGFDFLGGSSRLVRTVGNAGESAVEVLDTRLPEYGKKPLAVSKDPALRNARVTVSHDGNVFAVSSPAVTRIYKRSGEGYEEVYGGTLATVGPHLALSRDGTRLWTGAAVYDTATGREVCKMDRTGMEVPANVTGISDWVSTKTIVEIALLKADWPGAPEDAMERAMILWDVESGKPLLHMDAPDANGLCISPDGRQVCEAGNDMRLRLRNAQTLEVEREFRAHDGPVSDVEWHPTLPLLVSASDDLTVRIWSLKDGHLVEELHGIASQPDQRPERIAISADGRMLAVKGGTTPVGIYEIASAKPKAAPAGGGKVRKAPAGQGGPPAPAKGQGK